MNAEEKREIKDVLLGKVVLAEDGRLTTFPKGKGLARLPLGVSDGAFSVRMLGVMRRAVRYETKLNREKALEEARECMKDIGRGLALREQPDTAACLIRYVLTRPVVVTFHYEGGIPILTAWTGRSLTGLLSLYRAAGAFERHLPPGLWLSEKKPPQNKDEGGKEPKQGKKKKNGKYKGKHAQE